MDNDLIKIQSDISEIKSSVHEIAEAIVTLATHMDKRIEDSRASVVSELRQEITREIRQSEANTRDFVDRRVADAVAEIAGTVRKVDTKDTTLVTTLQQQKVVSPEQAKEITALSPFATM
jgi:maltooligosyltrehalose synthase